LSRLFIAVLFLFSLVTFTGCTNSNEKPHEPTTAPNERESYLSNEVRCGIVLEVEPRSIYLNEIPNFVRLTIRNMSDVAYRGGLHYAIDYHDGDNWIMIVAPIVPDEGIVIEPGETFVLEFAQLMPDYHNYVAGRYRVRFGNWYAEFSIFERTP